MTSQAGAMVHRAALGGDPVAALLVDIDHFKRINDTFGHDVGDEVLKEFALRLATNVRGVDLACRYGGEEFVVIMPDTALRDALRIAERLRVHVAGTPFRVRGLREPLSVTISVGVACTEGQADSTETLLKRADEAVYEAKAHGRNQVVCRAA
jgi:two-component system cell cycle response regulator